MMIDNDLIIRTFAEHYISLGWYNFMNRNKWYLRILLIGIVLTTAVASIFAVYFPLVAFSSVFILSIFVGGIDHIFLGISVNRTLKQLAFRYNIIISRQYLLAVTSKLFK